MPRPWTEVSTVKLREQFVLRALEPKANVSELCREFGISRQNGYKWLRRFHAEGIDGLQDRSRRPKTFPDATSGELVLQVLELRANHPSWGPKKLRRLLSRRFDARDIPSQRTLARILKRAGVVQRRRRRSPVLGTPKLAPAPPVTGPNDLWTADFKGWWRTHSGERCEPLTVRDAASRFVLALRVLPSTKEASARSEFELLFEKYGLPLGILTDNGTPFACNRAPAGLTILSAWWVSLGIKVYHSRPAHPQDNGGHERLHFDMRFELEDPGAETAQQQQALCDRWRQEFNHVRPHEALGMKTPAEVYHPSTRRRVQIQRVVYPPGSQLRRVLRHGGMWWNGRPVHVSRALRDQTVAVRPDPDGTRARVLFHDVVLGEFDLHHGRRVEPAAEEPVSSTSKPSSEGGGTLHVATAAA
jgi:putative transposase